MTVKVVVVVVALATVVVVVDVVVTENLLEYSILCKLVLHFSQNATLPGGRWIGGSGQVTPTPHGQLVSSTVTFL